MPTTRTEARAFIGKCQYYRRFIARFSAIARDWFAVMGKGTPEEEGTPIEVTSSMKKAFKELK